MAGSTDVIVKFLADVKSIDDGVTKIENTTGRIQKWAGRTAQILAGAFAVHIIGDFVDAADEARRSNSRLRQVLSNAGDATGTWTDHAIELADAMQRKTGIDDETIKGGAAILSTFHSLGGELGQQSGLFDRATIAALDLSRSGFGDVDSGAKALGKALEDPEKGLTALKKSGINFTDDQKKLIKSFVDSGDKAGAMNIILGEVERQVGGVAEKTATSGDKMKVAWDETKESLGEALLPVLEKILPMVDKLARFVQDNVTWLVPMAVAVAALALAMKGWLLVQGFLNGVLAAFGIELAVPAALIIGIALAILLAYAAVALLYTKWDAVWSFIGNLPWYAKVALLILVVTNPILLLISVVTLLAVYWGTIWGAIGRVLVWVWEHAIRPVVEGIAIAVAWLAGQISKFLGPILGFIVEKLVGPFAWAWTQIDKFVGWIVDRVEDLKGPLEKLKDFALGPLQVLGIGGLGGLGIPGFAAGGIVTRPTLAMLGERGPEAVVPLSGTGSSSTGGNVIINVHTTGLGADAPSIQSAVVTALRQYTSRNGPLPASITG